MLKKKQIIGISIWGAVSALMIGATIYGNVFAASYDPVLRDYFGIIGEGTSGTGEQSFTCDYADLDAAEAASKELNHKFVDEGSVLITNKDSALPLQGGSNISIFGMGSVLWMQKDRVSPNKSKELHEAFKNAGFNVNDTLRKFYLSNKHGKYGQAEPKGNGENAGEWLIDEVPQSEYTDSVKASYASYNDAAIVVLTRSGGEGADDPRSMDRFGGDDRHYLQLSSDEEDLLQAIKEAGFKKTIVLLHMNNPMQLDFLDKYNIDSVLWIGGSGLDGIAAVGDIFSGAANPSGRLVDTYCYDNFSSPAMQNFGDYRFVNADGSLTDYSYINYGEGIYVGYKYYETRYEDVILGQGNAGSYDYDKTVVAPFGSGLSYTTFAWSDYKCSYDHKTDTYNVSLKVTNTGSVKGKDVVEFYSQSEYTDYDRQNSIEKAAVSLCGFAKTSELEPNASETVTYSIDRENLATYDTKGYGTFIMDKGLYYITAGKDSHDAINNILKKKNYNVEGNADMVYSFEEKEFDTTSYSTNVKNRFDYAELKDAKYLSRSDWSVMDSATPTWMNLKASGLGYATGTKDGVSETTNAAKTVLTHEVDSELLTNLGKTGWEASNNPNSETSYEAITTGAKNDLVLADVIGLDYDDKTWDSLLDELSVEEMHKQYGMAMYCTQEISSISKPATHEADGPEGCSNYNGAAQILIASTWNSDLGHDYGVLNGNYALLKNMNGWYAPGMNLHRTPFSGRNFEYSSEDGFYNGAFNLNIVEGAKEKGCVCEMKHFAVNDQETNRQANGTVATFLTEQTMREIYLRSFRIIIKNAPYTCLMSAMNRVGWVKARACYDLNVGVLREEWQCYGYLVTDYNLMDANESLACLAGGQEAQLHGNGNYLDHTDTTGVQYMLRESAHHILYFVANSNAMNGYTSHTTYHAGIGVYVIMLIALDVVVLAILGLGALLKLKNYKLANAENVSAKAKKTNFIFNIVYWSVIGALAVAVIVVFFVYALPLLQQAFNIV